MKSLKINTNNQYGAATIVVVLVLVMLMSLVTVATTRTGVMEQQITGNDLRARETQEAAEAGLEYGISWAVNNSGSITTSTCSSGSLPSGCPTALTTVSGSTTNETYSYTLTYTKGTDTIRVVSVASGVSDSSITATSEAWIKQVSYLTTSGQSAPPMVINGGLSNVTGNPSIDTGNPPGTAIVTGGSTAAIDTGHLGGNPTLGATVSETLPATAQPAWDYIFSTSLATATATAIANGYNYPTNTLPTTPASGKAPFYVWDSDFHISGDYGSATTPVVIIIANGRCPKINGSPTIYGFIYFPSSCSDQGWGGATIYGTVISDSDITKLTANSNIVGNGTGGAGNLFSNFISDVIRIPGTWKDF